jgi:hypothetical protein
MQKPMKQAAVAFLALTAAFFLPSFMPPGGDSYSIYLNDTRVTEQYVTRQASIPQVAVLTAGNTAVLKAHYNHCGRIGSGRSLSLRSADRTLKEWKFGDVTDESRAMMGIPVSEIVAASSASRAPVSLVYASVELPEGKVLATLVMDKSAASLK